MKFYLDGIMFYFFRFIWKFWDTIFMCIDKIDTEFFHWIADRFGIYPDQEDIYYFKK